MKTHLTIIRNNDGFAALIALIMVLMLTLIGMAALSTSDDEMSITGNQLQETRAFYAAEGGLERAAASIQYVFDSAGVAPSTMPSGTENLNYAVVNYTSVDNGAAQQEVLTTGTLSGLHALVKSFTLTSTAVSDIDKAKVVLEVDFQSALIPIFQFAVFYENDLEIAPGPAMSLMGRVHTNGDLYLQSNNTLRMASYVTAAGNIYHGRKGPGAVGTGDVQIKDGSGGWVSMKRGTGWLESTASDWYDASVARWQGRVQDASHGQTRLNLPLNGAAADPHTMIEPTAGNPDSYEDKASLKIVDGVAYKEISGSWVNVTVDMEAKGIISQTTDRFYDAREGEWVDAMELDMTRLYAEGYAPANGVIYYSDEAAGSDWPALRLTNASELDAPLTVASANPVYTLGDYNSVDKKPASIMADAVTFLSGSFADAASTLSKSDRPASATTVNACVITGNVPTTSADYSGGFENLPRFLEDWNGVDFNWTGSMANLWESEQATGTWTGDYYNPPNRNWSYDFDLDDPANMPPETPVVRIFQRVGWQQKYVGYAN